MKILALNFRENIPSEMKPHVIINATSGGKEPWRNLSPFFLGPVNGLIGRAKNVENYWQYSKVYSNMWDGESPTPEFFEWRAKGFNSQYAHRYPMGKDKTPIGSWIDGSGLKDYVTSRKMLYIPAYTDALKNSRVYQELLGEIEGLWKHNKNLVIWDFDCFNNEKKGLTLQEIRDNPEYKYGHGFIIKDLLEQYIKNELEG